MSASGARSPASAANIVFVPWPCWQGCTAYGVLHPAKPRKTRPACAALTGGGRTACAAALFLISFFNMSKNDNAKIVIFFLLQYFSKLFFYNNTQIAIFVSYFLK